MRMVVTGAGGFLGAAVTAAGVRAGHRVVAVARQAGSTRLRPLGDTIAVATIDVADTDALERLFETERPDVVVHAAWSGLARAHRNGEGQIEQLHDFCRMVETAARCGVRKVVGIGSQAEYGATTGRTDESTLPQPISLYGAAKLAAGILGGRLAARAAMQFAWLRVFALYGPGDNSHWLIPSVLADLLDRRQPALTAGTQKVDYLFVDDAAQAVMAVASLQTADAEGVFNLASGEAVTVRELVETLRDVAAPGRSLTFGTAPFGANQVMHIEGAIDRIAAATGWRPTTALADGLARTVAAQA